MVAARTRLEIATENLANVSSTGFRPVTARGSLTARGVAIEREASRTGAGVDAIAQMIDVLAAERSFESAQKTVTAIDQARQKAAQAAHLT